MAKFEKLRISLARDEPGPFLKSAGYEESHRSRHDFLVEALSIQRTFINERTGKLFGFYPIKMEDGYAGGFFMRERPISARHRNLESYNAENYEIALFVMSVSKDQIAWMQQNNRLGKSKALIEAFFLHLINKTDINDWKVYVEYMDSKGEYFDTIRKRKNDIATIKFTFIPPNALGADDRVYEFIKITQQQAHPDTQQHIYKADPGKMDPETPMMEASARIAMGGGGDAEVRDGFNKVIYSSSGARTVEEVEDDEMPTPEKPAFVRRVILRLFGLDQ